MARSRGGIWSSLQSHSFPPAAPLVPLHLPCRTCPRFLFFLQQLSALTGASSLAQRFSSLGNHGPSPPKPGSHQRPRLPTQLFPRPRLCLCILSANAQQKHSATMSFQLPLKDFSKSQGPRRLQSRQRRQKPTWIQSKPGPRRENYPGRETNPKVNTARTSVSEAVYERNQDSLRLPVGAHFQRPSSARHPVGISTPRALLHRRQDPANE